MYPVHNLFAWIFVKMSIGTTTTVNNNNDNDDYIDVDKRRQ